MLKTNGSVGSREEYSNDVGSLVTIPARNPADRTPFGYVEFSITYRFAGVHQPGVAIPRPLATEESEKVRELESKLSNLTALLANMSINPPAAIRNDVTTP